MAQTRYLVSGAFHEMQTRLFMQFLSHKTVPKQTFQKAVSLVDSCLSEFLDESMQVLLDEGGHGLE